MHNTTVEKICDGSKSDVWVWAHIHSLSDKELHRPHLIEEDERADKLTLIIRHGAPHSKAVAQIAHARDDDQFERIA
jgi:hypothetical protein